MGDAGDIFFTPPPPPKSPSPPRILIVGAGSRGQTYARAVTSATVGIILRRLLLQDRVIGEILDVVHTEPIGHWHFAHSYVRGNWRREDTSAPSLLAKCCHDVDLLLWLLCSPPTCTSDDGEGTPGLGPHVPATVSSAGSLKLFKQSRKPQEAGAATNCLSCPIESSCQFSAKRIYVDGNDGDAMQSLGSSNRSWPVNVVVPDIESYSNKAQAKAALLAKLAEDYDANAPDCEVRARNWFGRCVWESDNDVCDSQVVTMTWDEEEAPSGGSSKGKGRGAKTATLHMVAQTKKLCHRYTHIYGEHGELYADSTTITVEDFRTGQTTVYRPRIETLGHGGGDNGLTRQFVLAVDRVKNQGWTADRAQREHIGCTLDDVLRSHAVVFCAEQARKGRTVVDFQRWWREEVEGKGNLAAE
ncbi:hypothetical protein MAPG_02692 [Magnaporthiopsis poae ATCC 64411]|uniref:Uncharacterized protein n=1 Tax=Magnaporthiopsis poae (strain ATCC 64411 / 73-15) TaxID=644358 RepID=A0A0C4DS22_MAGP6|nr:hypothetical protein MAPG_02692 [Magnaporthiopsis poae ATCC 64411]